MAQKFHIFFLIIIIGFLLIPVMSYSCEMKVEKSCCNKEVSSSTAEKMDCCKSKNKQSDGCNGKCGHSNCVTISNQFSLVFFEMHFKNNNFAFSEKKQNYFNFNTNISSGFYSLWLIPKIS